MKIREYLPSYGYQVQAIVEPKHEPVQPATLFIDTNDRLLDTECSKLARMIGANRIRPARIELLVAMLRIERYEFVISFKIPVGKNCRCPV